jgi:hypothetical protein
MDIRSCADGIGPNTRLVIPATDEGALRQPTDLVDRVHARVLR